MLNQFFSFSSSGWQLLIYTNLFIVDKKILTKQLKLISAGAIAYSRRENDEHIIAMAAPIFDLHHSVAASITVPVPVVRFRLEKEKIIEPALRKAADSLSRQIGFQRS